jgi:hypothetical protein
LADTSLVLPPELNRPELLADWDGGAYQFGEVLWDGPPLFLRQN